MFLFPFTRRQDCTNTWTKKYMVWFAMWSQRSYAIHNGHSNWISWCFCSLKYFNLATGIIEKLSTIWKLEVHLTTWHEIQFLCSQSSTLIPKITMKRKMFKLGSWRYSMRSCMLKNKEDMHICRIEMPIGLIYTFPAQITQLVFLEGTWQSILSPRMKKPVPPHHLHSTCPLELHEEQAIGLGCCNKHEEWKRKDLKR